MQLGSALAIVRRARRLTQADLARDLGRSRYWVSVVERSDDVRFADHGGYRLLEVLGVDSDELRSQAAALEHARHLAENAPRSRAPIRVRAKAIARRPG